MLPHKTTRNSPVCTTKVTIHNISIAAAIEKQQVIAPLLSCHTDHPEKIKTESMQDQSIKSEIADAQKIAGSSLVRLTLAGGDMKNVDWFGFSAPNVFWQANVPLEGPDGEVLWQSVHRSEHVVGDNNPRWKTAELCLYAQKEFDWHKPIRFGFWAYEDHRKHEAMGFVTTTIHKLQQAKQPESAKETGQWDKSKALVTGNDAGEEFGFVVVVDIRVELRDDGLRVRKRLPNPSVLALTLEGVDMVNMDGLFGVSDPFFVVETPEMFANGYQWKEFYKSEHIMDNQDPQWKPSFLDLDRLCRSDIDKPIRISFFDWQASGEHQAMGHVLVSVRRLLRSIARKSEDGWDLTRALCPADDDNQVYGRIVIADAVIVPK